MEHGAEAAIARADTERAAREADADRRRNLGERGTDANASEQRITEIRRKVDDAD